MKDSIAALINRLPFDCWHCTTDDSRDERNAIMIKVVELVIPRLKELRDNAVLNASRIEYCRKSDLYPRGYYYPDPLSDIIVSNARRGSIKKVDPGDAAFTYYFDDDNELSCVVTKEPREPFVPYRIRFELLFRFDNMRLGIGFICDSNSYPHTDHFELYLETRKLDGTEYVISSYIVSREWSLPFEAFSSSIIIIGFSNGMPVSQTEKLLLPDETVYHGFVLEYDEKGMPSSVTCRGTTCNVGRRKKPIVAGMIK